jgi:hypothetical protein
VQVYHWCVDAPAGNSVKEPESTVSSDPDDLAPETAGDKVNTGTDVTASVDADHRVVEPREFVAVTPKIM